jgi:hypothetical protein
MADKSVAHAVNSLELLAREQDALAERHKADAQTARVQAASADQLETTHRHQAESFREAARRLEAAPAPAPEPAPTPEPAEAAAAPVEAPAPKARRKAAE